MKRIAIQRCCSTPVLLKQYETSTDSVLRRLGVEPVDIQNFGCCGYPLRTFDLEAYLACSAKNISLAEKEGLQVLTFCNGCYLSLRQAYHYLKNDDNVKAGTNAILAQDGLVFRGTTEIVHLLHFLISIKEKIHDSITSHLKGLKVATHYGCQLMRPREVVDFTQHKPPLFFDELVEITGAESISWAAKQDCCGAPIYGLNPDISTRLLVKKILNAKEAGASLLCIACPFCQLQFDHVQHRLLAEGRLDQGLPCILYTQLLGLALGLDEEALGIQKNKIDLTWIKDFL